MLHTSASVRVWAPASNRLGMGVDWVGSQRCVRVVFTHLGCLARIPAGEKTHSCQTSIRTIGKSVHERSPLASRINESLKKKISLSRINELEAATALELLRLDLSSMNCAFVQFTNGRPWTRPGRVATHARPGPEGLDPVAEAHVGAPDLLLRE